MQLHAVMEKEYKVLDKKFDRFGPQRKIKDGFDLKFRTMLSRSTLSPPTMKDTAFKNTSMTQ